MLVQSGRELAIGIFGSAPDSATYFNRRPFISASRCPPPDQVSAFNYKTLGGPAVLPHVTQTGNMQDMVMPLIVGKSKSIMFLSKLGKPSRKKSAVFFNTVQKACRNNYRQNNT